MEAIEHNNKERVKLLGNLPVKEMTKREHIATQAMSALVQSMNINNDSSIDIVAELAVKIADKIIEKLN
jgi:hypothetical protein